MARVDVAYVEVRPDLEGFGTRLQAALNAFNITKKVRVEADISEIAGIATKMRAVRKEQQDALSANHRAQVKALDDIAQAEFRMRSGVRAFNDRIAAQELKDGEAKAKQLADVTRNIYGALAKDRIKLAEDVAAAEIKAYAEQARRDDTSLKVRENKEKQLAAVSMRIHSTLAADRIKSEESIAAVAFRMNTLLAADRRKLTEQETRERIAKEKQLAAVSLNIYSTLAKDRVKVSATVRKAEFAAYREYAKREKALNAEVRRRATLAASPFKAIAKSFSGRGPISAGIKLIFGSVGALTEAVGVGVTKTFITLGDTGVKVFANLASSMAGLFGEGPGIMGKIGKGFASLSVSATEAGASIAAAAGPVGAIVAGIVAISLAAVLATAALGAMQLVLGALLAVVIPLVAGITALVAEFAALGAVGVGALALLPGLLAGAAAAFGPLVLVMEKFQDLFTRTADRVGPLFEVFERLKNAMFAVISSGLIEALKDLATNVLPKLVPGLIAVTSAWNRLLLGAAKFASTTGAIEGMNAALQIGAKFVNVMADAAQRFGPALLGVVTASIPVLNGLLNIAVQLSGEFGTWIESMLKSGQLQALFARIGFALGMIATIARQVGPFLVGFLIAVLPPATQFLGLLGALAQRWADFMQSAQGQEMIGTFFTAMNQIITDLIPLVEQLFLVFINLGPTFAMLNEAAVPALMAIVDIFDMLVRQTAPFVELFLKNFAAALQDPATINAIQNLGTAISLLFMALSQNSWAISYVINLFSLFVGTIGVVTFMLNGAAKATEWFFTTLGKLGEKMAVLGLPFKMISKFFGTTRDDAKKTGTSMTALGTTTASATDKMGRSITGVANAKAWGSIQNSALTTAEYMVNMANNGIRGNELLIQSMAAMGAAAYAAGNEVDKQTFEKNVAKAYTGASNNLTYDRAAVSGFGSAGSSAGVAWGSGFSSAVDTSIKTSTTKQSKKKPFLSNMKPLLSSLDAMTLIRGKKSYDTGSEIARYLAKGITSGYQKNIPRAQAFILKNYKTNLNSILASIKRFNTAAATVTKAFTADQAAAYNKIKTTKGMVDFLAGVQKGWQETLDNIKAFKADVTGVLIARRGMVNYFGFIPTPAEVKGQLDAILAQNQKFMANIAALQAKNVDQSLIEEWIRAGPETAGNIVEGMQSATAAQIEGINNQYRAIGSTADAFAEAQAVKFFGMGEATMQGLIDGIKSMQSILVNEITKQMKAAVDAAKKALKIKSPSQIFEGIGADTMLGYVQGVASKTSATVGAIDSVYSSLTKVPAPILAPPTLAQPKYVAPMAMTGIGAGDTPVNIKVYLGTREITDIVRVEVEGFDSTRARALLAGRR